MHDLLETKTREKIYICHTRHSVFCDSSWYELERENTEEMNGKISRALERVTFAAK